MDIARITARVFRSSTDLRSCRVAPDDRRQGLRAHGAADRRTAGTTSSRSNFPTTTRTRCRGFSSTRRRSPHAPHRYQGGHICYLHPSMWNPGAHHLTFVIAPRGEMAEQIRGLAQQRRHLARRRDQALRGGFEGRFQDSDDDGAAKLARRGARPRGAGRRSLRRRAERPAESLPRARLLSAAGHLARPHHQGTHTSSTARHENYKLTINDNKELEISCRETAAGENVVISIVLPHGYPNAAPRIYADASGTRRAEAVAGRFAVDFWRDGGVERQDPRRRPRAEPRAGLAQALRQVAQDRRMAGKDGCTMNDRTFERIESLFDIALFADVKVLVAGCGSGGAQRRASARHVRHPQLHAHRQRHPRPRERHPACLRPALHRRRRKSTPSPTCCGTAIRRPTSRRSTRTS